MNKLARHLAFVVATAGAFASSHAATVNLVTNGGFETGDFTGWTQTGNTSFNGVSCGPGFGAGGSQCAAFFGPIATVGGISQALSGLQVGGTYLVDFDLQNTLDIPSSLLVTFGATTLYSASPVPASGPIGAYTHYNFHFVAAATSQTLSFSFRDDPGFFILDNVSVAVPEPTSIALVAAALAGLVLTRRARQS